MFSMFGRTGPPQIGAPQKQGFFHFLQQGNKPEILKQGFYGQGKSGNFEGVRESQGKQRGSGKSQGILKYCSLDKLFMHYFHNFCRLLGA